MLTFCNFLMTPAILFISMYGTGFFLSGCSLLVLFQFILFLFILCTVHLSSNNITLLAGQEKPAEQCCDLTPSSRGRQRRKNPKYLDFETDATFDVQSPQQKPSRRSSGGGRRAASKKTSPPESGKAENATQQSEDGEKETADQTTLESDVNTSQETPKKAVRAKKTPRKKTPAKRARKSPAKRARKTPAKKTPATDVGLPTGEGGVVDAVPQENGTPKPKRKYVRKRPAQEPVTEPPCEEALVEPEEETTPGGRRRRGAAKA